MIDGGIDIDLEAVLQNVAEADVITFYFTTLRRTLLIDTRCNASTGCMVKVVPIAKDGADRLRSLRRLRPQFPRPDSITWIPWDARVESLVHLGVWECLLARIDCPEAAERCLQALRLVEQAEHRAAIMGEDYQTLWSRVDE